MKKALSCLVRGVVVAAVVTVASVAVADNSKVAPAAPPAPTLVGIQRVTWGLTYPGGVGTFRVTVSSTGPFRAGAVWVQAISPGTATVQGPIGAVFKPGASAVAQVPGTGNGRCYNIVLAIEPDSAGSGVTLDPKNSSRRVCLDPDGAGIYN